MKGPKFDTKLKRGNVVILTVSMCCSRSILKLELIKYCIIKRPNNIVKCTERWLKKTMFYSHKGPNQTFIGCITSKPGKGLDIVIAIVGYVWRKYYSQNCFPFAAKNAPQTLDSIAMLYILRKLGHHCSYTQMSLN